MFHTEIILKNILYKKSQQKRRTSPCNYKERFFVLSTQQLTYSEPRPGKKPILKGCIELSRIKCVEIVRTNAPIPCKYKYPFLVVHDNYFLYIFAPDNDCRLRWVRALKEETKQNNLSPTYHPDLWMDGRWRCCHVTDKCANGCHPCGSVKPLPPTPDLQRVVVALRDFVPSQDMDLPLHKDEEYFLTDSSQPNWWMVQDRDGKAGLVPCTYVAEKSCDNFTRFAWYNKNITRTEAEELLLKEGKEGAFMVRDSRQAGVYTVSVFTKAPGSNGEKFPRVKHYQIRQSEEDAKFYLAEKYLFSTIPELIHYHQHNAAGLITRLRHCVSWGRQVSEEIIEPLSEMWELDPEELELQKEVGSGQFGLVWQGQWRDMRVAIKTVKEGAMSEEEFQEEAQVMKKLSHPKLVQLLGVCMRRSPMYLVFEFMEGGCLVDYLRAHRGALSLDTLLGMCLDVSEGMAYLESSNYIHRDLAARNCLVSKDLSVKVSDFGMTRFVLDDQYTSSQGTKFPIKWSAPEVITHSRYSSKSDVWSFGILMWEVYSEGRMPYENRTNNEVIEDLNAGMRLLKPRLAPAVLYPLMQWCWKEKPGERPSFALLLHELACLMEL